MMTRTSKSLSRALLALALLAPALGGCSAAPSESVEASGEAITSCGGVENGTMTCTDETPPAAGCRGDSTLNLLAGVDSDGVLGEQLPLIPWAATCTYTLNAGTKTDDVQRFMNAMHQIGAGSPVPISVSRAPGAKVFLAYDMTSYEKVFGLSGVTSVVNEFACNTVVAPGLFRQVTASGSECADGNSPPAPVQIQYFVLFDPKGCGPNGCGAI